MRRRATPQTIAFHPVDQRRVISPLTAAQMRQMMQGVVLHGTGKKALLEGYSFGRKNRERRRRSIPQLTPIRTRSMSASFAGFAPVNNPAITVAVILDSAVGLHQGGQVSAPVFQRVAQQVLEYLHTPHDVELPRSRQVLLASRQVKDREVAEGSPDHLGDPLEVAEAAMTPAPIAPSLASEGIRRCRHREWSRLSLRQMKPCLPEDPKPIVDTPQTAAAASTSIHPSTAR